MSHRALATLAMFAAAACRAHPDGAADTIMRAEPPAPAPPSPPPAPPVTARFEDYPVADTTFRGRPAPPRIESVAYGRMYRTRLREGAARGPDFAGHHTVVLWGCGTGCQIVAVVDARTGRLSAETLHTMNGVSYRRSSALLIADPIDPANPPPPQCASCGTPAAYVWRGGRFVPVGDGPHPQLGGYRPWQRGS